MSESTQKDPHPIFPALQAPTGTSVPRSKIVSAAEAVSIIRDGDTLVTGGFVGIGFYFFNFAKSSISMSECMIYLDERGVDRADVIRKAARAATGFARTSATVQAASRAALPSPESRQSKRGRQA